MAEDLKEERAIQNVITRAAHNIDRRRWDEVRNLYADVVLNDFTSILGGEAALQKADDMLAAWKKFHGAIDVSQHFLGPIDVEVSGENASAECHVRAYHRFARAPGGEEWMVAGHYRYGLTRQVDGWRIKQVRFEIAYQTGNTNMFAEAGQ
ncbi:nuclear transport factor 2 family protein [Sorangium sp. So ce1014]|uniref:nuclear transport factor 2 family protein n=1 Tax=Sorangium sp. So ce1014 TaxID=3133326 RepID=UPI003F61AFCE